VEVAVSDAINAIQREIRALRKGRGVHAADLDRRVGQHLRQLVDDGPSTDAAACRRQLIDQLNRCVRRLPGDVQMAITASLGLHSETAQPHLKDRVARLSAQIARQERTAFRRIKEAEQLLAEEIAAELQRRKGRVQLALDGWHLKEFRVLLRLDTSTPEAHEHRMVAATRDGLDEIVAWLDYPREAAEPEPDLRGEVLYGGRLDRKEHPSRQRFQFVVRLPRVVNAGEIHEYGLLLRVPPGQTMRPHYIFTPERPCSAFSLRVRFDPDDLPRWVRRVEGETVRAFDDLGNRRNGVEIDRPDPDLLVPDSSGEVAVEFTDPALYLGYGVQWQPMERPTEPVSVVADLRQTGAGWPAQSGGRANRR
jgi:hypothetical protein